MVDRPILCHWALVRIIYLSLAFASAGCGSDAGPGAPDGAADAEPADTDAPAFEFPNGEPGAASLYFRATCVEGGCDYAPFDEWFTGALTVCAFDGSRLELGTGEIPGGAYKFSLELTLGAGPSFALDPLTTRADWSLPDGASAFLWMNNDAIETQSSGTVSFARCGAEVTGQFDLVHLCEYHSCSTPGPWIADVVGAFRCTPPTPVACGL